MDEGLPMKDFEEIDVPGDGSCQFHAMGRGGHLVDDKIPKGGQQIRQNVANFMKKNRRTPIGVDGLTYEDVVTISKEGQNLGGDYSKYCESLETNPSHWGDAVEADAFAHLYNVQVHTYNAIENCRGADDGNMYYVRRQKANRMKANGKVVNIILKGNHYNYLLAKSGP